MKRRKFLSQLSLTSTAVLTGSMISLSAQPTHKALKKKKPIKFIHITDSHVVDQYNCQEKFELFMQELSSKTSNPDIIFHTGDVIMDALKRNRSEVKNQWELWQQQVHGFSIAPFYAIGNHDIWGSGPKNDPLYGKKWAMDEMKLESRFYSFNKGNWKFMVLDSTQIIEGDWYTAKIDEEQKEWMQGELDNTSKNMNVMIISHIPILSAGIFNWAQSENSFWRVKTKLMHEDSHSLQNILRRYTQVKLCISGHLHLQDKVTYDGIDYLGAGAVCGNWWEENTFGQTQCGFAHFNLYEDGNYERTYHIYKWI